VSESFTDFYSDNRAPVCPEILNAIAAVNRGPVPSYGEDAWTQRLDEVLSEFFDTEVRAFTVATGTAANALSLAALAPAQGDIFTYEDAHIVHDECGAPDFFSGALLVRLPGKHAKLTPDTLVTALEKHPLETRYGRIGALSITQLTELGTAYTPGEIAALSEVAHARGLGVFMDGARLANAIVFLDCQPSDVTWRAGVDVLSFGATKNGALAAEVVVFFDLALVRDFDVKRKQAGHVMAKSRYAAAQFLAYIESQAWRRNAAQANALARQLARSYKSLLLHPVEGNEVFLCLGEERKRCLRAQGIDFHDWGAPGGGQARFVMSWDQSESDVARLCATLDECSRRISTKAAR
jgi:threonine aldolase